MAGSRHCCRRCTSPCSAPTRIYPTYAAFLAAHPDIVEEGSNLVLVTGPSRTADIEMTLTRGVHGPAEVITVLIEGPIERQ